MKVPVVAIVGRPNVGKSTLFNRIVGRGKAIVGREPGITHDRISELVKRDGKVFFLLDTAGLTMEESEVRRQTLVAVEEADVLIFVLDAKEGLTPLDYEVAKVIRESRKPTVVVANKTEAGIAKTLYPELFELGFEGILPISAIHNIGISELMERVLALLPSVDGEVKVEGVRVAIVGRPNVGKSTLFNRILSKDRSVVSREPGTTRDPVEDVVETEHGNVILVDTCGIRRKSRISSPVEAFSVERAKKSIELADVVLLVVDSTEGLTRQDKRLAGLVDELGKGLVVLLNKWDIFPWKGAARTEFLNAVKGELEFVGYAPIIPVSALTGKNVKKVLELIFEVEKNRSVQVRTSVVNEVLRRMVAEGILGNVKAYYGLQIGVKPPTFLVYANRGDIKPSVLRAMGEYIRKSLNLVGTGVRVKVKKK